MKASADFQFIAADLAPGDVRSLSLDVSAFRIERIHAATEPAFDEAYAMLHREFGAAGELESRAVLAARLAATAAPATRRYELFVIRASGGRIAAVHDQQATTDSSGVVIVHLSHALVHPDYRRTGLAGWLRALPIQTACRCSPGALVTLVGEMEHANASMMPRMIRLSAYERAGYRKIDPQRFAYFQPDFRPPAEIDQTGGARPLPLALVIRQVGREAEMSISGRTLRAIVEALYRLYALDFRPAEISALQRHLQRSAPPDAAEIALVPPTALSDNASVDDGGVR